MIFAANRSGSTVRTSSFLSKPEELSDEMIAEAMFVDADNYVHKAMMESFCAVYQGMCANDKRIIMEGFSDFAKSAYEFFKNIVKKIWNFVKNAFNYIMSYITDFDKFIDKYKENVSKFKPFEVSGYEYTINMNDIPSGGIDRIVNQYNKNVKNVSGMSMDQVRKIIQAEMSKDVMSTIRGEMCGKSNVKADKFEDALNDHFRGGKKSKSVIKVDSSTINKMIDAFKELKEHLSKVKDDSNNVTSTLDEFSDFFKGMPNYDYKDGDRRISHYKLSHKDGSMDAKKEEDESYGEANFRQITAYYNFCFKMCKEMSTIYTKTYSAKIAAIKEALSFYRSTIRRALSPFGDRESEEGTKEAFEYGLLAEAAVRESNTIDYFEDFDAYVNEMMIFGDAYHTGMVVFEDVELTDKKSNGDDKGIFTKIVEFIKKIIAKFMDTAANLFKTNKGWLESHAKDFEQFTDQQYSGIKFTIVPYWAVGKYEMPKPAIAINRRSDGLIELTGLEGDDFTDVKLRAKMYPEIVKKSINGDLVEGAKIYFRGGSNNLVSVSGGDVKTKVGEMLQYCNGYSEVANNIRSEGDKITKEMEDTDAQVAKMIKESALFSIAEGLPVAETLFASMPWIVNGQEVVHEEVQPSGEGNDVGQGDGAQSHNQTGNSSPGSSTPATGTVTANGEPVSTAGMSDADKEKAKKEKEEKDKHNKDVQESRKRLKMFYQSKLKVYTSMLTISEERYYAYLRTLRQIHTAIKGMSSESSKPEEKK